jgi:hypothetical protein
MIIRPQRLPSGDVIANTSFLVPHLEETRARLLDMPFEDEIHTIAYDKHWDYYTTLHTSEIWGDIFAPKLMMC